MARIKSTAFEGTRIGDIDVDAPTHERLIDSAIGDTALVFDKLTGSNAEANTINHDGTSGRGALLGIPYVNQYIGKKISIVGEDSRTAKDDGAAGQTYLVALPIFIPSGEDQIIVDVLCRGSGMVTPDTDTGAFLRDPTTWATVGDEERFSFTTERLAPDDDLIILHRSRLTGVTPGLRLFFIELDTAKIATNSETFELLSLSIHPGRKRARYRPASTPSSRGSASPIPVTTPAAGEGVTHVNFDSSLLTDVNDSLNGYITTRLNRNQNGLTEYLTGWPAGGNLAYVHVDHDGGGAADDVDPARSRFFAHTQSLYASEPEVDFPLWAEAFGAFRNDGKLVVNAPAIGTEPDWGMLDWFAPWPTDETSQVLRSVHLMNPDFQRAPSRMKWAILVGYDATVPTAWAGIVVNTTTIATAITTAFAAVGGAGPGHLAWASGTIADFAPDVAEGYFVGIKRTGIQAAVDELLLLGACVWFEP